MSASIETTTKEFSKYLITDMNQRLHPMSKLIDDMQARLEEFQTMVCFAKQERIKASNVLESIRDSSNVLEDLFQRIDAVEGLVDHVKDSLNLVEKDIEKAEEEIGYTDISTTTKVASIFTPLFKKNVDKTEPSSSSSEIYKTSDYFNENKGN